MANRASDWFAQAGFDLQHARNSLNAGDYEWACFAAQQAAEKAVKALILHMNGEGWGYSVARLLLDLADLMEVPEEVLLAARRLDKHYIPARYPNGFDAGAPRDYYTSGEAGQAITDAESIHQFCGHAIRGPKAGAK
ncbi:MAG: HEPN domain-containing protein [Bacillota bacterium]